MRRKRSGDWIENLTALEYHCGKWRIYSYKEDLSLQAAPPAPEQEETLDLHLLQQQLIHEFQLKP